MKAYWVNRERSNGETSIQIRWHDADLHRGQSETFSRPDLAAEFKKAVAASGCRWPRGWVRGAGWARDLTGIVTVDEVFADWVSHQERRVLKGRLKPYTLQRYRRDYANHVQDQIGAQLFSDLSLDEVDDWIVDRVEAGLKPKTVRNIHGSVLAPVVKHGITRMRLRPDNPCDGAELPEPDASSKQVRFYQHDEWALFRSCLDPDVHDLCDTMLAAGLRWGEVSALQAGDLVAQDEDTVSVHIQRAWTAGSEADGPPRLSGETARWRLGSPKGNKTRWVSIHGATARRLMSRRQSLGTDDWLFVTRRGNPWRYADFYTDRWRPAVTDARHRGLERHTTPHMLRHTAVVWSLAEGVPIQVVSHMIGHASIQITFDVYGGLINLHDPEMAKAMSRAMLTSAASTVNAPTADEVALRRIRPGGRGTPRRRVG
jgi:integrase